jgi:hypothetical protein
VHVQSFDSFEEMERAMKEADEAAFARITPTQAEIRQGDAWMRPAPDYGCVIFGRVHTDDEIRQSYGEVDDEEAALLEDELAYHVAQLDRGYMFGRAWSVIEPDGELGSTHQSTAWPITDEQLQEARDACWDHKSLPWFSDLLRAAMREGAEHG